MPEAHTSISGPSGEHRYTVLDDLNEAKLARLFADGFEPCAVVETSRGNFQAWLNTPRSFPSSSGPSRPRRSLLDTAPTRAQPIGDASGRLPGFTNCKVKYKRGDGLFPFVRLHSHSGQQFSKAQTFLAEIIAAYEARELQREQRRTESVLSPQRGPSDLPP